AAAQNLGGFGVAEDAGLLLGEDALARERAQEPVERLGVRADLARDLLDRPSAVGERIGHAELGHERRRARAERASQQAPDDLVRSGGAPLERAARTAAAAPSPSASVSVLQSRKSRPRRGPPTTGRSAARKGA